jgi:hypothetical protein
MSFGHVRLGMFVDGDLLDDLEGEIGLAWLGVRYMGQADGWPASEASCAESAFRATLSAWRNPTRLTLTSTHWRPIGGQ